MKTNFIFSVILFVFCSYILSAQTGPQPISFDFQQRMKHYKVPGMSIAVVKDGKIVWAEGFGIANTETGSKVSVNTLFQAGSISKPLAALAALKLVEEGKVDLDEDVNTYLKTWKLPDNKYTRVQHVTLRLLLTHSAGTTVHGFPGYRQEDKFPSINEVLDGKGNTDKIRVNKIPGSEWKYSGGGYTIMEKMVEDVSGMPLEQFMAENILKSMEMVHSIYEQPLPEKLYAQASAAYDQKGELIKGWWHNYPEQAAAGLWTTPTDLAKYCIEVQEILKGKKEGVLSKETIKKMLTKHLNNWGMGPSLSGEGETLVFEHGGKNAGFTNGLKAYANKGNAVIIMTSADNGGGLISELLKAIADFYGFAEFVK